MWDLDIDPRISIPGVATRSRIVHWMGSPDASLRAGLGGVSTSFSDLLRQWRCCVRYIYLDVPLFYCDLFVDLNKQYGRGGTAFAP